MATVDVSGTTLAHLISLSDNVEADELAETTLRLSDGRRHIKECHTANCLRANPDYGRGVARAFVRA
jgi:hypothetical protein